MKKRVEEGKKAGVAKVMKDTPVEKTNLFEVKFDCVGKEITERSVPFWKLDWSHNLDLSVIEFDLGTETGSEVSLRIRFTGVQAYKILQGALDFKFNIKVTLMDSSGLELYSIPYNSMILEEVYGLQLSLISESEVPNFIARFHKRIGKKGNPGWHKTYGVAV